MRATNRDNTIASIALQKLPPNFVVHRGKEPLNLADTNKPGPHRDPANQRSMFEAMEIAELISADGIGFSVPQLYCIVDFDNAVVNGEFTAWALAVLAKLPPTFVEISPSGRGLHAFIKVTPDGQKLIMAADKATSISDGKVELLRPGFYATVTGNRHAKYPDDIAELDTNHVKAFLDRITQTARSNPSLVPTEHFDESIYKASEEDIIRWRSQIRTGDSLHEPTFMFAWWSAYNGRPRDEVENELYDLYEECPLRDERWRDRRKKLPGIISRCYHKAAEYRAKTAQRRADMYRLTEDGMARYVQEHDQSMMVYTSTAGWLAYNGKCYERLNDAIIRERQFQLYIPYLKGLYAAETNTKRQTDIHKFILAVHTNKFRANTELISRGVIHADYLEFDQETTLLNCQNGVVDLSNGMVFKHDPSFKMTHITNMNYVPEASNNTPIFDKFIREFCCYDEELMHYLLMCMGYSLTGETREQKFFVMYGGGGNGKSTLNNIVRAMIGPPTEHDPITGNARRYFAPLRSEAILEGRASEGVGNDLAALIKARYVLVSEVGDRKMKDERIKALVGEDSLQVRFLFQEFFEAVPRFKLWMQTNQRPRVRGNDNGIWRRAIMLPCLGDFRANPDVHLPTKLAREHTGIFAKLVKYAQLWYKTGLPTPPKIVAEENVAWKAEVDPIARFLEECVEIDVQERTTSSNFWRAWMHWAESNNERAGTSASFYNRLRECNFESIKYKLAGVTTRGYQGVKLIQHNPMSEDF